MSEHEEQCLLFGYARQMEQYVPEFSLLFAVPNEQSGGWKTSSKGKRYNPHASSRRAEGMKGGVPDVFLPVPRGDYHGMWVEMKYGRNYLSEEQINWCAALVEQSYRVDVWYSAEDAFEALCEYLGVIPRFIESLYRKRRLK